jgi:hypothetical protein
LYKNGGHAAKSGFAHPTKVLNYFNTCRIRPVPVICPTCQIFVSRRDDE